MGLVYGVSARQHSIRVKLYPNYLPKYEGTFLARTDSEAPITLDETCASVIDRRRFEGTHDTLLTAAKALIEEIIRSLMNGDTVNLGPLSLYFNVGGTFKTEHDTPDHKSHPLTLRTRVHSSFAKLLEGMHVEIEGFAGASGCIDIYHDEEFGEENHMFLPGNMFIVYCQKGKIEGPDPSVGLYFVPVDNPGAAVKVMRILENHPSKIVGIAPQTGYQRNRIEIRTQYAGSGVLLKAPRVITSPFILEEV